MSSPLEERVELLEQELAAVKAELAASRTGNGQRTPWWERIAGSFAGDSIYHEAMQLGREYREAEENSGESEAESSP